MKTLNAIIFLILLLASLKSSESAKGIAIIEIFEGIERQSECLLRCLIHKTGCKSFNFSINGTCILLKETLCSNETYELTPNDEFSYHDIMSTNDYETKHFKDQYCQMYGKCSGKCYPRNPHFVFQAMTRREAYEYCQNLSRSLPQPKSQIENSFYGDFGRKVFPLTLNSSLVGDSTQSKSKLEKQAKRSKYWIGISDEEVEDFWVFDDGSVIAELFSAWAFSQPDNGGSFNPKAENCGAIEMREYNWLDLNCDQKLNFFCA